MTTTFDVIHPPDVPTCVFCDETTNQMFRSKNFRSRYLCMGCANRIETMLKELRS